MGFASSPSPPRTRTRSWCLTLETRTRSVGTTWGSWGSSTGSEKRQTRNAKRSDRGASNSSDRGASSPRPPPSDTRWCSRRMGSVSCSDTARGRRDERTSRADSRRRAGNQTRVIPFDFIAARATARESSRSPPARRTLWRSRRTGRRWRGRLSSGGGAVRAGARGTRRRDGRRRGEVAVRRRHRTRGRVRVGGGTSLDERRRRPRRRDGLDRRRRGRMERTNGRVEPHVESLVESLVESSLVESSLVESFLAVASPAARRRNRSGRLSRDASTE